MKLNNKKETKESIIQRFKTLKQKRSTEEETKTLLQKFKELEEKINKNKGDVVVRYVELDGFDSLTTPYFEEFWDFLLLPQQYEIFGAKLEKLQQQKQIDQIEPI